MTFATSSYSGATIATTTCAAVYKQIESRVYGFIICMATSSLNLDLVIKVSVPSLEPLLKDFVARMLLMIFKKSSVVAIPPFCPAALAMHCLTMFSRSAPLNAEESLEM